MSEGRHIVLIHRYYYPDTPPYASILRQIAEATQAAGHRVTVLTCQPSYNRSVVSSAPRVERDGAVTVRRCPVLDDRSSGVAKVINLLLFALWLLWTSVRLRNVDVVMAASTPPVVIARLGSMVARSHGSAFVYHHQDIWPEIRWADHGKGSNLLWRFLRRIDSGTDRLANAVVVLSQDMKACLLRRGVAEERIHILNNFDPWVIDPDDGQASAEDYSTLRVVYAGNLGHFQNLDAIFVCLTHFVDSGIRWTFVGTGARVGELRELVASAGLRSVEVMGYRDPESLAALLRSEADIGLVTLNPGVIGTAYPSKTMSYLRNGVPVLALVEESALSGSLTRYNAGWSVDPAAPDKLVALLNELAQNKHAVRAMRANAQRMYHEEFSPELALPRWVRLFETVN